MRQRNAGMLYQECINGFVIEKLEDRLRTANADQGLGLWTAHMANITLNKPCLQHAQGL